MSPNADAPSTGGPQTKTESDSIKIEKHSAKPFEVVAPGNQPQPLDAHLSINERKAIDRKLVWKLDLHLVPWPIIFSAAAISGSFGGLLAAAMEKLEGRGGRPGWS
ncbi:hypothetical protein BDZ45DRAFT_741260 [Acephala macrosclerotiorum]|nr:hypothetical protein BDZ45DRAFT_741260 [Acephala macrosclerotiorum]